MYLCSYIPFIYSKRYKKWFIEQRNIFQNLNIKSDKNIWVHCASLGEYEQIKPLIGELRKYQLSIVLTFFSPSGYLNFNDFHLISQLSYLPLDTTYNMNRFLKIINPNMVIVSKNDIWPNMLHCVKKKKIPLYLVGYKVRKQKTKNWLIRQYYKKYLVDFSYIFCQDNFTYEFLKSQKINDCSVIGDLRIRQVLKDSKEKYKNSKIESLIQQKKTIIYGSVEENDYQIILNNINSRKDIAHIIVPHDIDKNKIKNLTNQITSEWIMYSAIKDQENINCNVLILDTFGILKKLYRYSKIAYIGGGFDNGVHNTLEPAIYNNLLLFGPNHKEFLETEFFIENKIAYPINDKKGFEQKITLLLNYNNEDKIRKTITNFFNRSEIKLHSIVNRIISKSGIQED